MSAETLRRAAALMRERAKAMLPEEMTTRDGSLIFTWADQMGQMFRTDVAAHVGAFGRPAVALAVADWLENYAALMERDHPIAFADTALDVARAYLRESV